MAPSDPIAPIPDVGPYRCVRLVWSGQRNEVWLGKGPFEVDIAVKRAREAKDYSRLAAEAGALSKVDHPSIVRLMDRGPDNSWLVLEWVRGEPMDQWAKSHSIEELMRPTMQLVDGLKHMHEHGVIHGDIKPSNVLVDDAGQPTIIDLGVATLQDDPDPEFRGTLGFAAPELLRGARPSPASDLYSLGAMLYCCLTQRMPFSPKDPAALTYVPMVSLPVPPSTWAPEVPLLLEQAVMKLLARSPERRPSDLGKVRRALQAVPTSRASRPILGMHETRDLLRHAVVSVADGGTRVVVVYGSPGCGRNTLIEEAVEAARREGLVHLREASPKVVLASVTGAERPSVCRFEAEQDGAVDVARESLHAGFGILILLRSERAIPALAEAGALQTTPPLMSAEDAMTLITALGGQAELAKKWWKQARGLPAGIIGRFHAWRHHKLREKLDLTNLPEPSLRILEELRRGGEAPIPDLAARLSLGEHQLLDYCAVLFAQELVEPAQEGGALRAIPQPPLE
ncbi:MAG: serine/threonine-protein kinase PknK [Deltaproteobacteria bacterium]|nr:serine/threonine-protein kinase PknK [Deltaproteobacteria bacterium]